MLEKEAGKDVDEVEFERTVTSGVREIVRKQFDAGVDVVNDGEAGKVSYSTYVKDRLSGFGGEGSFEALAGSMLGLEEFPDFLEQMMTSLGQTMTEMKLPACDGPISYVDTDAVKKDIDNLKKALKGTKAEDVFMSAASPGVVSVFCTNKYYPSEEAYLEAIANAMREEYEAIHRAGIVLQLDCPDLAMTAPISGSVKEHRKISELRVEALNHAVANIPAEAMRLHVCWGNAEHPHHRDVPLKDIIDIIFKAKPAGISIEAANPRHEHEWQLFEDVKLPEGKYVIPGVLNSVTNFIEHPELVAQRITRYAERVGRENVMAGTDCGFATFIGMHTVAPTVAWAKLQAMSEGARLASKKLWPKRSGTKTKTAAK